MLESLDTFSMHDLKSYITHFERHIRIQHVLIKANIRYLNMVIHASIFSNLMHNFLLVGQPLEVEFM